MNKSRTAALIAGILTYLFIGLIYAWSIFVAPLEQEFGWTRAQTALTFTVSMSCFCIGGIISGYISKKKTSRFIVRLAATILLAGFIMASRVNTVLGLYLTYGIFCGLGVGLAYNITISTVVKWFPERVGFISGLLMMCFGFGGMLLGSFASAMVSLTGWRVTFIMLGFIFAILLLLCSLWLVQPEKGLFAYDTVKKTESKSEEGVSVRTKDMIKGRQFWFYI
jgi:OFA family oxalate/formate antiporter-like MFS transporter